MSILTTLMENIKVIGGCAGGLVALGGGYIALDGPIPATRQWTMVEVRETKKDITDGRLEINDVKRQLLRKEKFDRTLELEKTTSEREKALLRERLEWIEGQLDEVTKAREELRKGK